jgi:DNA polymerase III delta prime subunit
MILFTEKYKPKNFGDFIGNDNLKKIFNKFCSIHNFPNILITGNPNSGKKTIIELFIQKFNNLNEKIITKKVDMNLTSNKNISFSFDSCPYYMKINPSDYGIYDKNIIIEFISDFSSTPNVISDLKKIIIIDKIDKLSVYAQECLRSIIDKNNQVTKFILIGNNYSGITDSLKSRTLHLKINTITITELDIIIKNIETNENIKISNKNKLITEIFQFDNFLNIKTFIHLIQMNFLYSNYELKIKKRLDELIEIIINDEVDESFIDRMRDILYEYYVNHFPSKHYVNYIINKLLERSIDFKEFTDEDRLEIIRYGLDTLLLLKKGNKEMIHMEIFIYKIKKLLMRSFN